MVMQDTILQKSLFGGKDLILGENLKIDKPKNPSVQKKSNFPKFLLKDGFDTTELQMESVFWHRILQKQYIFSLTSSQNQRKFIRTITSEIKLKSGKKSPEILIRDLLLMKNLG